MIFETFSPCYYGVFPIEKTFQICYWTCLTSQKKLFFISRTNYIINLLDLYIIEKWFSKIIWPYLNYNHLINSLKIPTKIWRCQVMFLNHFCAIIYLIHCIFLVLHLFSFSGPVDSLHYNPFIYLFLASTKILGCQ